MNALLASVVLVRAIMQSPRKQELLSIIRKEGSLIWHRILTYHFETFKDCIPGDELLMAVSLTFSDPADAIAKYMTRNGWSSRGGTLTMEGAVDEALACAGGHRSYNLQYWSEICFKPVDA